MLSMVLRDLLFQREKVRWHIEFINILCCDAGHPKTVTGRRSMLQGDTSACCAHGCLTCGSRKRLWRARSTPMKKVTTIKFDWDALDIQEGPLEEYALDDDKNIVRDGCNTIWTRKFLRSSATWFQAGRLCFAMRRLRSLRRSGWWTWPSRSARCC